jgi:hypothetical protein
MSRNQPFRSTSLAIAAAIALGASGAAVADDNSMSIWTGDSYAHFNDLDYRAGSFNVARAPMPRDAKAGATAQRDDGAGRHAGMPKRLYDALRPAPARDERGG